MKTLILMRHAKSGWEDPALSDHDRPLNRRGRLAAALMGAWLVEDGLTPDRALVSSAARTVETWRRMGAPCEAEVREALYLAPAAGLIEAARRGGGEADTLLILAHQPGMQGAAETLTSRGAVPSFPTGAAAVVTFDGDWEDLAPGAGRLKTFAAPKLLV